MNSLPPYMVQNNSILNTDTLEESQININYDKAPQKQVGKYKNFLEALRYVNSNKYNNNDNYTIKVNTTTEEGLNVSEYSKTNAHFSREENIIYNNTYDKTMNVLNNNIFNKKYHKKCLTNANVPYHLNSNRDYLMKPINELINEDSDLTDHILTKDVLLKQDLVNKNQSIWKMKRNPTQSINFKQNLMIKDSLVSLNGGNQLKDLDEESDIQIDKKSDLSCSNYNIKYHMKNDMEHIERVFDNKIEQSNDMNSNGKKSKIIDSIEYSSLKLKNEDNDFFTNFNKNSVVFNVQKMNKIRLDTEDSLDGDLPKHIFFEKKDSSKFSLRMSNETSNYRNKSKRLKSEVSETSNPNYNKNEFEELSNLNSFNLKYSSNKQGSLNTKEKNLIKNEYTLNLSDSNDINYTMRSKHEIKVNLLDKFNQNNDKIVINSEVNKSYSFQNKNISNIFRSNQDSIVSETINERNERKFETTRFTDFNSTHKNDYNSYSVFDINFTNNLVENEKDYFLEPNFLMQHPNLKIEYRIMLLDWLMQLCEEFGFKRDTFHYSVNYIDRYISFCLEIEKDDLQLIGVVCLSLAAKFEEVQIPRSEEYIKATDNSYTLAKFIETEKIILKALNWRFLPPTINLWLNWYLCQWDLYLESFPFIPLKILNYNMNIQVPYFKKADENSYNLYRKITQMIDLIILDTNIYLFNSRMIVASAMFLIFGIYFEIFDPKSNLTDLNYLNSICFGNLRKKHFLNEIYSEFLLQSFGFQYSEIFFSIIYASKFKNFMFSIELPLIIRSNEHLLNECSYEELLSYQTHNSNNYAFVTKFLHSE